MQRTTDQFTWNALQGGDWVTDIMAPGAAGAISDIAGIGAAALTLGAGSDLELDSASLTAASITLQATASAQPTLITGTPGADSLAATANDQVLTGLGGGDTISATGFTGVVFRDTAADLSGSTIRGFTPSGRFDFTDLNPAKATLSYSQSTGTGTLSVTDGIHSAIVDLDLGATTSTAPLPIGYFVPGSDDASGTSVTYRTVNTDSYAWNASASAYYSNAVRWRDTTTGTAVTVAPSYGNDVTIAGLTSQANIAGSGAAASLTTTGSVLLLGTLAVGTKAAGVSGSLRQSGTLALDHRATLTLASTAKIDGLVDVAYGSTLTAASLSINGGTLESTGNSAITATGATDDIDNALLAVDAISSIEFGPYFSPVKGALKLDYGISLSMGGTIDGNVVVNGTLTSDGALSIEGYGNSAPSVSGFGTLEIGSAMDGDELVLGGSDSAAILFSAPSSDSYYFDSEYLILDGSLPTGTISGFTPFDSIMIDQAVTGMSYRQTGSTGKLTLTDGAMTLGTLTLAGTYSGGQFLLQESPGAGSATLTYLTAPTAAQAVSQVSSGTDNFFWEGAGGGAWGNAANWENGYEIPATDAPGINSSVYIENDAENLISGDGSAADLNNNSFAIFTGAIKVTGYFEAYGDTLLESGASLTVGGIYDIGSLQISGGSTFTATTSTNEIATVTVIGGSTAQIGDDGGAGLDGTIAVDSTSSFEFGTVGPTLGAFSIDAGQGLYTVYSGSIDAALVVNGLLVDDSSQGGGEIIEGFGGTTGAVTGSGTIDVTKGARLILNATDSVTLSMSSGGDTLELVGSLPTGTLTGFAATDAIQIDHGATGLSFSQTTATGGVLTVTEGAQILGTIALAGSYNPGRFHLDVAPLSGVASVTLLPQTYASSSGPAGTSSDAYLWGGSTGVSWANKVNWLDTTTGAAATAPPGGHDDVAITGGNTTDGATLTAIGGSGAAAALAITGDVMLTGAIAASGSLSVASGGTLALDDAAHLTAAAASLPGELEVGGASTVAIAGATTLTGGALLALDGSTIALGGLTSFGTALAVDGNSSIVVGATTGAAKGAFTVQTGVTVAFAGGIAGSVVAAGTLEVVAGGMLSIDLADGLASDPYAASPTITGGGTLVLTSNSTLGLGAADSAAIRFAGPAATLQLAVLPTVTISGFTAGDTIQVDQAVTGIGYTQSSAAAGTLALYDGATTIGTLALAGAYNGAGTLFHLQTAPDGSNALITLQTVGLTQPTLIQGTSGSDVLTATAAGQTLTGLGGDDTLNGAGLGGVTFKDLTADLNGSSILGFTTSDLIDFTDLSFASAVKTYTGGVLTVGDGSHAATVAVGFSTTPSSGGFVFASDGGTGTKLTWHS